MVKQDLESGGAAAVQIICWLDGNLVMPPLNDNTFTAGKIGFWTKSDAVSYFGDTTIIYTPRVPVAQTLVQSILKKQPRILGLRIYTLDDKGQPRIAASKDEKEIGQPGTDAEKAAITDGKVYFGRGKGTVAVTLPLRDRNGDPMAAVRVQLKSFLTGYAGHRRDPRQGNHQKNTGAGHLREELMQ